MLNLIVKFLAGAFIEHCMYAWFDWKNEWHSASRQLKLNLLYIIFFQPYSRAFFVYLAKIGQLSCFNCMHINNRKGTSKNYVDHFCPYFDHLPTSGWHICLISLLSKVDIWRSTYLPPFVNIVFGCPLTLVFGLTMELDFRSNLNK